MLAWPVGRAEEVQGEESSRSMREPSIADANERTPLFGVSAVCRPSPGHT